MAREIKFRAWDTHQKKMHQVDQITLTATGWDIAYGFGVCIPAQPHIEIMQFTGRKNKNGEEIYEGDLFKCIYAFDGCTEHIFEVYWPEWASGFHLKSHGGKCQQPNVEKGVGDMTHLEIIGNIHENPDLLTTQETTHGS